MLALDGHSFKYVLNLSSKSRQNWGMGRQSWIVGPLFQDYSIHRTLHPHRVHLQLCSNYVVIYDKIYDESYGIINGVIICQKIQGLVGALLRSENL